MTKRFKRVGDYIGEAELDWAELDWAELDWARYHLASTPDPGGIVKTTDTVKV